MRDLNLKSIIWTPLAHRIVHLLVERNELDLAISLNKSFQIAVSRELELSSSAVKSMAERVYSCQTMFTLDDIFQTCELEVPLLNRYLQCLQGFNDPIYQWLTPFKFHLKELDAHQYSFEQYLCDHDKATFLKVYSPLKDIHDFLAEQCREDLEQLEILHLEQAPSYKVKSHLLTTKNADFYQMSCQGSNIIYILKLRLDQLSIHDLIRISEIQNEISHQNILQVLFSGTQNNRSYQIFEKHGDSLDKLVMFLAPEKVISIFIDIGQAIERMHHIDIVHGDIKPGNIFYDLMTGIAKLGDFDAAFKLSLSSVRIPQYSKSYASQELLTKKIQSKSSDCFAFLLSFFDVFFNKLHQKSTRTSGFPDHLTLPDDIHESLMIWIPTDSINKETHPYFLNLIHFFKFNGDDLSISNLVANLRAIDFCLKKNINLQFTLNHQSVSTLNLKSIWAKEHLSGTEFEKWNEAIRSEKIEHSSNIWNQTIEQQYFSYHHIDSLLSDIIIYYDMHLSHHLDRYLAGSYFSLQILESRWPYVFKREIVLAVLKYFKNYTPSTFSVLLRSIVDKYDRDEIGHHPYNLMNDFAHPLPPRNNKWAFDEVFGAPLESSYDQSILLHQEIYLFLYRSGLLNRKSHYYHRKGTILTWITNKLLNDVKVSWTKGPLAEITQRHLSGKVPFIPNKIALCQMMIKQWEETRPILDILRYFIPIRLNPTHMILNNGDKIRRKGFWSDDIEGGPPCGSFLISAYTQDGSAEIIPWPF